MERAILTLILISISLFAPLLVSAEVYNCNGTWRDKPCDAPSNTTNLGASTSNQKAREQSLKRSLIHELAMKAFETSREYKIRYDVSAIENYCLDKDTSLIDCQERVYQMNDRIDQRVASLELIKEQKRANDLQKERNEIEANKPPTQINILEENTIIFKPKKRYPYTRPGYSYKSESTVFSGGISSDTADLTPSKVYTKPNKSTSSTATINDTNPSKRVTKPSW